METIEPKERERIEKEGTDFLVKLRGYPYSLFSELDMQSRDIYNIAAANEHLHLTNTVIEPLRKEFEILKSNLDFWIADEEHDISKLEAENKELKESNARISENFAALQIRFGESETDNKELRQGIARLQDALKSVGAHALGAIMPQEIIDQLLTKNEG